MAVEKRVVFAIKWLPWVLLAPQVAVIGGVLLLAGRPGTAAVDAAVRTRSARRRSNGSGWRTSATCWPTRPTSPRSRPPRCSRCWWPARHRDLAAARRVCRPGGRGATIYKTLLIWPYAVAPAVAGVLWLFMFAPRSVSCRAMGCANGRRLEPPAQQHHAMILIVMAAVWKQISYNFLFFLAGLQSIPKSLIEAAAIDGAGPVAPLLDHRLPAAVANDLLPAGHQHRLRLLRHLRDRRRGDPGRAGQGHRDPGLQGLLRRLQGLDLGGSAAQSVVLMVIVIALTVVQFRFVEKKVNY
jgi:sn-glycerol 3-phosphate transport system permease protein